MRYQTVVVEGMDIFYREAGDPSKPTIVLLHGFPSSSHMFRDLLRDLEDRYHLLAPDYPGFGYSSAPGVAEFDYTFDHLAHVVECFLRVLHEKKFSLYVQDYGAPIGFRIATKHPEWIEALLVQNGNAYEEGIAGPLWASARDHWQDPSGRVNKENMAYLVTKEGTYWQYTDGARELTNISPDAYTLDQAFMDRPGNAEIQLKLLHGYGANPPLYPAWQAYFRQHQPPTLITWGKNDSFFPPVGAEAYLRDLPNAELHLLDTGHFALEEDHATIARLIDTFLRRYVHQQPLEVIPLNSSLVPNRAIPL
jgi:pimeloyl-ACP methyl ester carboxylesterase